MPDRPRVGSPARGRILSVPRTAIADAMPVSLRDAKRAPEDREWVRRAYREYLEDLSRLETGVFPVLGEFGERGPDLVAHWFTSERACPLLVLKSGRPVGFALVVGAPVGISADFRLTEFFIQRPHRRLGVGREAAQLIFSRFTGRWEVSEYSSNVDAVKFWRRVIGNYTDGRYVERMLDGEVHQRFNSAVRAAP